MTPSSVRAAIATLGCKVNQYDSAALTEDLQKNNFVIVPFNAPADVYIINTCSVTAFSDFQARQLIRRAHRTNPQARIIVTGCYAQIAAGDIAAIDGVTMVVGNDQKDQLVELLQTGSATSAQVFTDDIFKQKIFHTRPVTRFRDRTRAFLKIQDGCNSFCSYCIVPYARGMSRSMPPQDIFTALAEFTRQDYKEIVLTGIHLGTYGHDLAPATNLSQLLNRLFDENHTARIRLSSIEPREITTDLLHLFKNNDLLCPHLHIPLQSGDDRILQLMKRNYDVNFYRKIIHEVIRSANNIAIGVDVMVGFPSESDEQFNNTLHLLQELPVAYLHVFPYSERPGTKAQNIGPKVPENVKKERAAILRNLSNQKRENFALRFLEKPLKVLVEKNRDKKTGLLKGFSENYLPFLLDRHTPSSVNKIITIKAEKFADGKLYGTINTG